MMDKQQDRLVLKGYVEGYKDGFPDGKSGVDRQGQCIEFKALPISVMPLSARARNCMTAAGCVTVGDVSYLREMQILKIRSLGEKTANEIAVWLAENGIYDSAWSKYL